MNKKFTLILSIVGLIVGLFHPTNTAFGVDMPSAIAFAIPWALFFGFIGLIVDYFINRNKS